jgi:hypothetical protein
MLTLEQKETQMNISGDLFHMAEKVNEFFNNIITGEDTWCFLYDLQTKWPSSKCKSLSSSLSKQFRVDRSKGKVILEVFLTARTFSLMGSFLKVKL